MADSGLATAKRVQITGKSSLLQKKAAKAAFQDTI
jgi:hypothetical protein